MLAPEYEVDVTTYTHNNTNAINTHSSHTTDCLSAIWPPVRLGLMTSLSRPGVNRL